MRMEKYFQTEEEAKRYKQSRIDFHIHPIKKVRDHLKITNKFSRALDVGCGVGQSSQALLELSQQVIAIDPSQAMLNQAILHPSITYLKSSAEKIDFPNDYFDIVCVAQTFHWLNRRHFFTNLKKILKPKGFLIIYGNDVTHPCIEFYGQEFKRTYSNTNISKTELTLFSLKLLDSLSYSYSIKMNKQDIVDYLTTLSSSMEVINRMGLDSFLEYLNKRIIMDEQTYDFISHGVISILIKI
jgi:ubiquinone/menaquinone biosynthesis C-methylase UbiE